MAESARSLRSLVPGRISMRIWLGAAFATVGLITAASVYVFVRDSSGRTLASEAADLAVGRASRLADELAQTSKTEIPAVLAGARSENFAVWAVNAKQLPLGDVSSSVAGIERAEDGARALTLALQGRRYEAEQPGDVTVVAAPIFDGTRVRGAVLARATPPPALRRAVEDFRDDSVRALALAIVAGILIGFVIASLIAIRVKRLALSAERMAGGELDQPLPGGGGDEIGDLALSLDTMREALRESFDLLATERDRLSAILDGLDEAVIVVGEEGSVRFSNPAAKPLVASGQAAAALIPFLRRAAERGAAENPWLTIDGRVYALQARRVPAEGAVLVVVRERTEELRREISEREFVSNAAHELRNPLAGISGAIEVLRGGAKDDPEARDHFLHRLDEDAERMTRLTQSLLTLARVEAVGAREAGEVVDVEVAIEEALAASERPEGIEVTLEVDQELPARGDPVMLRQVLVGLLNNAYANTPPPGTVTVRARRRERGEVIIEVQDTGTGIPPAEQERVFERFYRTSDAREGEGFGLGLSIAKRMLDVMGGEIGVRSQPGAGSTFWVRLRAHKPTPTPVA